MQKPSDTNNLGVPWLFALCLLVLNDHWLKTADLVPGWLTGKLSDFAGLVVAPLLAMELIRARRRSERLIAFSAPVVVFVAINLSPAFARMVEEAMGVVGISWRIWTDPTDLIALLVLPLAWKLANEPISYEPREKVSFTQRVMLALGAFACMATSVPTEQMSSAYIVNHTGEPLDVRVELTLANVDCDALSGNIREALSPDLFTEGTTYTLQPDQVLPLFSFCGAALIDVDGLEQTLVYSPEEPQIIPFAIAEGERFPAGGIELLRSDGRLEAIAHEIELHTPLEHDPISSCQEQPDGFQWSVSDVSSGAYRIEDVEDGIDDCFRVLLAPMDSTLVYQVRQMFLCIPPWSFPFESGQELHVDYEHDLYNRVGTLVLTSSHTQLVVSRSYDGFEHDGITGVFVPAQCDGRRSRCGAFGVPLRLELQDVIVRPGETVELSGSDARIRLALGRAEQLLVAHPSCEVGRQAVSQRGEVILLKEWQ